MKKWKNKEKRGLAMRHRRIRATILEMHMKTLRARYWDMEYEEWTKTPEYQEEGQRLRKLRQEVDAELAVEQ